MRQSLDYAIPSTQPYRPLWPALLVALVGCPVASIVAGVLEWRPALGWWPSTDIVVEIALWGAIGGGLGGIMVAAVAVAFRSRAMWISIVGSLLAAAIIGGSFAFFWAVSRSDP